MMTFISLSYIKGTGEGQPLKNAFERLFDAEDATTDDAAVHSSHKQQRPHTMGGVPYSSGTDRGIEKGAVQLLTQQHCPDMQITQPHVINSAELPVASHWFRPAGIDGESTMHQSGGSMGDDSAHAAQTDQFTSLYGTEPSIMKGIVGTAFQAPQSIAEKNGGSLFQGSGASALGLQGSDMQVSRSVLELRKAITTSMPSLLTCGWYSEGCISMPLLYHLVFGSLERCDIALSHI